MNTRDLPFLEKLDSLLQLTPNKNYYAAVRAAAKELRHNVNTVEFFVEALIKLGRFKVETVPTHDPRVDGASLRFIARETSLLLSAEDMIKLDTQEIARLTEQRRRAFQVQKAAFDKEADLRRTLRQYGDDLERFTTQRERVDSIIARLEEELETRRAERDRLTGQIEVRTTWRDEIIAQLPKR